MGAKGTTKRLEGRKWKGSILTEFRHTQSVRILNKIYHILFFQSFIGVCYSASRASQVQYAWRLLKASISFTIIIRVLKKMIGSPCRGNFVTIIVTIIYENSFVQEKLRLHLVEVYIQNYVGANNLHFVHFFLHFVHFFGHVMI